MDVIHGTSDRIFPAVAVGNVAHMSEQTQPVSILSETESWQLLSSVSLGRLVTSVDGEPAIFPLNFVVQHRTVLFRTAEGTKLVSAAINNRVLFEADDHGVTGGWSVIVRGQARILRTDEEIDEAERAQLLPWTATVKQHYVRIRPLSVTGRRFAFGSEPDRELSEPHPVGSVLDPPPGV
jgi:nitroimidazol reductase NimA-like FMN-containing flavoprotein (pyridoxamine 5'-phosphate oxidase superfamily)